MASVTRFDETWHRLREWTAGQTPSERLAAVVLDAEGYEAIDPSHPLGGKDGGADALVEKDGEPWVLAVYFPRGQQKISTITDKLASDLAAAKSKVPDLAGLVVVTNQELLLAQRRDLGALGDGVSIDLIHLERLTTILDRPRMAQVREQFLDIPAGPRPILVAVEIDGVVRTFDRTDEVMDAVVEIHKMNLLDRNDKAREPRPFVPLGTLHMMGVSEEDAQVLSNGEIDERVHRFREELMTRWQLCQDYLAAIAWPAVHFKIINQEASFLTDVQVILTFHGARGLEHADIDEFRWPRLVDPAWRPSAGPFGIPAPIMPNFTPAGYPVSWEHNDDGDLELTIDLPSLRPHPAWRHTEDDVVVVLNDSNRETLTVTYTVTARGYGTVFEGDPIEIPVEHVDMFDSVQAALKATTEN